MGKIMSIKISDKTKCTGCYACQNVCPVDCISMKEDISGFVYPVVDNSRCVECKKCERVCPVSGTEVSVNASKVVFAAWSNDMDIRYNSTSGGVFSELAYGVIGEGGSVAGAVYSDENVIKHAVVSKNSDIEKVRQSKYAQSEINNVYREISNFLKHRKVLFCGTPCQVAGLKSYLARDYENLITVDFVCRGVNSPKAFREWIKEIQDKQKSKVKKIWFKYKEDGWRSSPEYTKVTFENSTEVVYKGKKNHFMFGYIGGCNLYIRPSCGDCRFKGEKRVSDITLGDFWGLKKENDDDMGISLVIVNSDKGMDLLNSVKEALVLEERSMNEINEGNICFNDSVCISLDSEKFLSELGEKSFSRLVKKYTRRSIIEYIRLMFKYFTNRLLKGN